jgi:hypothetical protein
MRSFLLIPLVALALLSHPSGSVAQQAEPADQQPEPAAQQPEPAAQPTEPAAQNKLLTIELNRVQQSQSGCRLSFMAVNRLGADLQTTAFEIVFFDPDSIVSQMLLLDFGRLPKDKTKVVEFDLPQACEQISRVLVNDILECAGADEQNMTEDCFNALRTSNKAGIEFGV